MKNLTLLLLFCLSFFVTNAQMWNGQDTVYGNEWIDYNAQYFKIKVATDGVYRILGSTLEAQDIPLNVPASTFRLYRNGEEVPMFSSSNGIFTNVDYLEFFGQKNRHEIDQHLFTGGEAQMGNPDYALFNDTSAYYLTFSQVGTALRYAELPNDINNAPPKENYCLVNLAHNAPDALRKVNISQYITHTWFNGDSWGPAYAKNYNTTFPLPGLVANGPNVKLQTRYLTDYGSHRVEYRLNDSLFHINNVSESNIHFANFVAPPSFFTANTVKIAFLDTLETSSRIGYGMTNVEYPRSWDLGNTSYFKFSIEASNIVKYVEASAFNVAGGAVVVYDLSNKTRLTTLVEGGLVKFILPPSASKRELVLVNTSSVVSVNPKLSPMVDLRTSNADYIIITSPFFRYDSTSGLDYVQEFADYRASTAGGSHTPIIVDINQLYDQFAYGNAFNPISIRNFAHFAKKHWVQPSKVFFIGKGLEYKIFRTSAQQAQFTTNHIYNVPVFGNPGADIPFFTANKPGKPILASGRLAVTNPSEIKAYLEKVKEYELNFHLPQTLADKGWIKRALHLSGAPSAKGLLAQMENVAKNNKLGYEISYFEVTTNDPIQVSNVKKIQNLFKEGVSIVSYLGHSAPGSISFDIGAINEYENQGKYPFFAVFGCFTGLCSAIEKNLGEKFTLEPNKGSIAYMASTSYSYDNTIGLYAKRFYEMSGSIGYHQSIAENIANTVASFDTPDASMSAIMQQMHFQGDPAIQLYNFDGADYVIDNKSIAFQPNPVSVETDSFLVKFDVVNIGEGLDSNFVLTIDRTPPNDTLRNVLTTTIPAPKNRTTLAYKLPTSDSKFIGFNRMNITVDQSNIIPEMPSPLAELNNRLLDVSNQPGVSLYFFNNDVSIVYPSNFSIIPTDSVTLSASTLSTFNNMPLMYIFQIDTTVEFNSQMLKSKILEQNGGLLQWTPDIALIDSTVYYWRVTRDSLDNGALPWKTHSFVHIKDSPLGWHQSHFYQYTQDSMRFFRADSMSQKLQFAKNATRISVKAGYRNFISTSKGINNSYNEGYERDWQWNWDQLANLHGPAIVIGVVNPNNGRFVKNPLGSPSNSSPTIDLPFFVFRVDDSLQRVAMMDFMQNGIPDQSRVIMFGHTDYGGGWDMKPELWANDSITYGTNIYQLLEAQGSTQIRELATTGNAAFGVIYKKNDPSVPLQELINYDINSAPSLTDEFLVNWVSGTLTTTKIGPAAAWGGVYWDTELPDNGTDTIGLTVIGVKPDNTEEVVLELPYGLSEASLSQISATQYPYLRLVYFNEDTTNNTAVHPTFFRVTYEPIPEGAVDPLTDFVFFKDTLEQGQNMFGQLTFKNVSLSKMDSVQVNYSIENASGTGSETFKLHQPLNPGDTLRANITLNTASLSGDQRLIFDVNPNNHQPELYHFNNVYIKPFFVREDMIPPLLDVTFDGVHILNGDLVSPKPEIIMTLNDENKYLALNDTADFRVYLKFPDGTEQRIYFTNPDLLFFPADASNLDKKNKAKLEFRPYLLEDGEYKLRINGTDANDNIAGRVDYEIIFKVINKSALSNIMNYPNPFSTSTCFVYTMTGLEQPASLRIRILTVAGRVVREIDGSQFGIMRAGTHISDYCWDGKDEYGDQLANGVYYYQVIAKKANGEAFDLFENSKADGFFKNGYGKMVLMR